MAKKIKFCAYRKIERPYTRYSKYRSKSFVKNKPNSRVVRYDMGDENRLFSHRIRLLSKAHLQIRDLAIESSRLGANRWLEKKVGKGNFKFKIRIVPHHMLRNNPLAAGAGADRMSTGMKHSFGKIIGIAAQVKKGQTIMEIRVDEEHVANARIALKRASQKIPCSCSIVVEKIEVKKITKKAAAKAAQVAKRETKASPKKEAVA